MQKEVKDIKNCKKKKRYIPSITVALTSFSAKPTDGLETFSDILWSIIPLNDDISGNTSLSPLHKEK